MNGALTKFGQDIWCPINVYPT